MTGDASAVSNKADGAASAGLENSVLFATSSSASKRGEAKRIFGKN